MAHEFKPAFEEIKYTGPKLVNKGEWISGEDYKVLDYVTRPNTTVQFLCIQDVKSDLVSVLKNDQFWREIGTGVF